MTRGAAPTLPPKERLILELLTAHGPLYGLQLVDTSGGALKRGTVYVTLARLEAKRFIASATEALPEGAIGLPRRVYTVTALGERALAAWTTFTTELAYGV